MLYPNVCYTLDAEQQDLMTPASFQVVVRRAHFIYHIFGQKIGYPLHWYFQYWWQPWTRHLSRYTHPCSLHQIRTFGFKSVEYQREHGHITVHHSSTWWVKGFFFILRNRKWSLLHSTIKHRAHLKNLVLILLLTMM